MADDSESPKKAKRRLRPAPETVREKAQREQESAGRPTRRVRTAGKVGRGARRVARPLRVLAVPFRYQPFKFIAAIVRFIGRIIWPRYLRNSWKELRLVIWPNRTQTRQLTVAVLLFAAIFGALVTAVDYGLDKLFKEVIIK